MMRRPSNEMAWRAAVVIRYESWLFLVSSASSGRAIGRKASPNNRHMSHGIGPQIESGRSSSCATVAAVAVDKKIAVMPPVNVER